MPVIKVSNLKSEDMNVITKRLRRREIILPSPNTPSVLIDKDDSANQQNSSIDNDSSISLKDPPRKGRGRPRRVDTTNEMDSLDVKVKSELDSSLDDSNLTDLSKESSTKRIYRKKKILPMPEEVLGPRRRQKSICRLGCCPIGTGSSVSEDDDVELEDDEEFKPNKRVYRKRHQGQNEHSGMPRKRSKSVANLKSSCLLSTSLVEIDITRKRRLVRKKHSFNFESKHSIKSFQGNSCPSSPASFIEIDVKKGKKVYHKKGYAEEDSFDATSPKKSSEEFSFKLSPSAKETISHPDYEEDAIHHNMRPYRRRTLKLSCLKPLEPSIVPNAELLSDNAVSLPTVNTPPKRIPKVPHNTPVCAPRVLHFSDDSSLSLPPIQKKRGRGRPRKEVQMSDEEWNCASSTTLSVETDCETNCSQSGGHHNIGNKSRRSRPWEFPELQQLEEDPISEYELQRQRNIQQNLEMLRQIFRDSGLDLKDNSSDDTSTLKVKKPYTRLPLPPPRPKSARLEDRKSTGLLDFSKFSRKISLD